MLKTSINKDGEGSGHTIAQTTAHPPKLTGLKPLVLLVVAMMVAAAGPILINHIIPTDDTGQTEAQEPVAGPTLNSTDEHTISWTGHDCTKKLDAHPAVQEFTCAGVFIESWSTASVSDTDAAVGRIARTKLKSEHFDPSATELSDSPLMWRGGFNTTAGCENPEDACTAFVPVLLSPHGHQTAPDGAISDGPIDAIAVVFSEVLAPATDRTGQLAASRKNIDQALTDLAKTVTVAAEAS